MIAYAASKILRGSPINTPVSVRARIVANLTFEYGASHSLFAQPVRESGIFCNGLGLSMSRSGHMRIKYSQRLGRRQVSVVEVLIGGGGLFAWVVSPRVTNHRL